MRFLKHIGRLFGELLGFAWENKAWWIIPVVLMLLLLGIVIIGGQGAAPFIYLRNELGL